MKQEFKVIVGFHGEVQKKLNELAERHEVKIEAMHIIESSLNKILVIVSIKQKGWFDFI